MADVYFRSGAAGANTGADWANAFVLGSSMSTKAAGDRFWFAADHSETTATTVTWTSPGTAASPCTIRCVNHAGTVPPVSADLTTGAIVACTGAGITTFNGYADCDGIDFRTSSGGSVGQFAICSNASAGWKFGPGVKLTILGTGSTSAIVVGSVIVNIPSRVEFSGTILKFGAVGQGINMQSARFLWRGGSVDAAGSIPTNLIVTGRIGGLCVIEGVDLSASGSGKSLVPATLGTGEFHFKDCKIDAAVTIAATPSSPGAGRVFVSRTSATGITYGQRQYLYAGNEIAGIGVVRTGGAAAAHMVTTTANAKFIFPYNGLPLAIWNPTTGADIIVTIEGIANMATIPKNDEVWIDVEYLGTAANPLGSIKSGAKADILATGANLTASTEAWDTGVTARANTMAYALGDVIKVASNPGRVFFCTTANTTAGTEPAGYASAVDGDSVTDDTAVFRAGFRFKQAVTLTSPQPQLAGFLYVYPKVGVVSTVLYLDRKPVLS